ncbi:hypothetical protein MVA48_21445 [Blastococcus sp. PRF04-17]|nr:hypothetical protein MVA48_21445 [Blastococcus sp. PRF04-17]
MADEELHGVAHHGEVLLQGRPQGLADVPDVGLRDQADHGRLGVEEGTHLGVVLDADAGLARGAEGDQLGVAQLELGAGPGEELGVLRQRARPAALDEPDPDLVQQARDRELVGDGVADALALRAVAQGGVEDVEVEISGEVGGHAVLLGGRGAPGKQKDPREREVCAQSGTDCALGDNDRGRGGHRCQ